MMEMGAPQNVKIGLGKVREWCTSSIVEKSITSLHSKPSRMGDVDTV